MLYLYFFLFIGPAAAFIASVVQVYWLFLAEIIIKENLSRSFFIFWITDYITIIVFTPLFGTVIKYSMANISQKKKAAEQLHMAATAFESHKGIMITDKNFNIILVNKAFTEITGYSREHVVGKSALTSNFNQNDPSFYSDIKEQLTVNGRFEGEIWKQKINGDVYPEWQTITAIKSEAGEVSHFVCVFSDITEKKQAENIIYDMAFYDPLTKIPNRRLLLNRFDQELATAKRHKQFGAVIFLDLDHFKYLNDTQGHLVGDLLLVEIATRLVSVLREEDTPARLGGDEFVILLHANTEQINTAKEQAWIVANKIKDALNEPVILDQCHHHISTSIGIALFPDQNKSTEVILQQADTAMYRAKANGRNSIEFYVKELINKDICPPPLDNPK